MLSLLQPECSTCSDAAGTLTCLAFKYCTIAALTCLTVQCYVLLQARAALLLLGWMPRACSTCSDAAGTLTCLTFYHHAIVRVPCHATSCILQARVVLLVLGWMPRACGS
jgi:hypothetical protein